MLLTCILIQSIQIMNAQDDYEDYVFDGSVLNSYNLITRPSIQAPDVAAFQKVTQIPVSNYTGRANVSIPIYTIKSGNMTVPISLTYNTSGVKVADMPSNVGSNWALNAGGAVTRNVKGIDDMTYPEDIDSKTGRDEKTPAGWLYKLVYPHLIKSGNQQNDPMPDLYHVNAPGLSTQFIHDKFSETDLSTTPIELEHHGNKIETTFNLLFQGSLTVDSGTTNDTRLNTYCYGLERLKVTSLNGVEYTFATPEIISTYGSDGPKSLEAVVKALANRHKSNANKLTSMYDVCLLYTSPSPRDA